MRNSLLHFFFYKYIIPFDHTVLWHIFRVAQNITISIATTRLIRYFSNEYKISLCNFFYLFWCSISFVMEWTGNEYSIYCVISVDYWANHRKESNIFVRTVSESDTVFLEWMDKYRRYSVWYFGRLRYVHLRWAGNRIHRWCAFDTWMRQNGFSGKSKNSYRKESSLIFAKMAGRRLYTIHVSYRTCMPLNGRIMLVISSLLW